MEKQNIHLKVIQNDLLEHKELTIFTCKAYLDRDNDIEIFYQEKDETKVRLRINDNNGLLIRKGEALTQLNFDLKEVEQCKVTTTVGDIYMDVRTLEINIENNQVFIHYELLEAEAVVGKFQLRLEWENE